MRVDLYCLALVVATAAVSEPVEEFSSEEDNSLFSSEERTDNVRGPKYDGAPGTPFTSYYPPATTEYIFRPPLFQQQPPTTYEVPIGLTKYVSPFYPVLPPTNGRYVYPPTNGGYVYPPTNGRYVYPPTNGGYVCPPTNGGYVYPPTNGGYVQPPLCSSNGRSPFRLRPPPFRPPPFSLPPFRPNPLPQRLPRPQPYPVPYSYGQPPTNGPGIPR